MHDYKKNAEITELYGLKDRVAVVTGAPGRVGRQLSLALAQAGATVVVADLPERSRAEFVQELKQSDYNAIEVGIDITREESVEAALEVVMKETGRIDILVNNAGVSTMVSVEDMPVAEFERVMRVNVTGTFICSKVFSRPMIKAGRGSIINVGSIYGVVAADQRIYDVPGPRRNSSVVYAASKAAIIQMTRYLAIYWADKGIRVNAISPGGVFNNQNEEFLESYCSRVPMGRMVGPTDLMGAVVFLASDASTCIIGQNLIVDGGWTAW